jgi:vitamin B12 transporter
MRRTYLRPLTISALVFAAPAWADEPVALAPVEVTATRLPTTQAAAGVAISVITQDDIERAAYRTVADAIEALPGVSIARSGAPGGTTSVFIRGLSGDGVLVLIDGVPANDPASTGGGFNFATLDASSVERIEILRGAQSTLWGSGAEAGVIAITTKRGTQGVQGSFFVEGGSYDTFRTGGTASGATDYGDFAVTATRTSIGGFSSLKSDADNDGLSSLAINARGGVKLPGGGRLGMTLRRSMSTADYDPGNQSVDTTETAAALTFDMPVWDDRADISAQVGYAEVNREFASTFGPYDYLGERRFARVQATVDANDWNTVTFGAEHERFTGSGTYLGQSSSSISSVFGLWETRPIDGLTLSGGLRQDEHSDFGGNLSGRLSAAYDVTKQVTLRGGWGTAFKAPSLSQRTYGNPAPNPDLTPETSQGWEAGIDFASSDGRFAAGATVFQQWIEDEITYFSSGAPDYSDGYANVDETSYSGLELTGSARLTSMFVLSGTYTYTDAHNDTTDTRLIRRPRHAADAALAYDDGGPLRGQVSATYNGGYPDFSGLVDSWIRVDAAASYAVTDTVEVYGRLENIFDVDYEYVSGYNTAGRSGYLGLRAKF